MEAKEIKNIAIIAHVDHGKTTLVDKILHQCQLFRENQETGELILDSDDLEKERGITIFSKNVSINYRGFKINIIDTPGHSDFGGEVERVLNMADGVLLLVDAFEGPMPQTRFVLQKALEAGLSAVVVINKVDKKNCRPQEVLEQVFDLFINLQATEKQLDFPVAYGSSRQGWMSADWKKPATDLSFLLDTIINFIPSAPKREGPLQLQITSLDYSSYTGRIAIGRVYRGQIAEKQPVSLIKRDGTILKSRIKELFVFEGLGREKRPLVKAGDICAFTGVEGFDIGDTVGDFEKPEALPSIAIDEPVMSMLFTINNSPFFGRDGNYITSRHLRERLVKETQKNLALRVEETPSPDSFMLFGRGILHLSILIETMRRESFELQVGQPRVLLREIDGIRHEPIETLCIDVPSLMVGQAIEIASKKMGELISMENIGDLTRLIFDIPARGLIGLRTSMLNATGGQSIIAHHFKEYQPWKGDMPGRNTGAIISKERGLATAYSLDKLQDRGSYFISPGDEVYTGQVIGQHNRTGDIVVNICTEKKLTNMRAAGSDDKAKIAPAVKFSLEESMEYIQKDELVEITPKHIRMRKILLNENDRKKQEKTKNSKAS